MFLFGPIAAGLALAFLGWIAAGLVRSDLLRAVLRALSVAVFATPTIVGGHGVAVVSALHLVIMEGAHPFALVPMAVVAVLTLVLVLSVPRLRRSRTAWPLDLTTILLRPTYPKLVFYGFEVFLFFAAAYEPISKLWPLQFGVLLGVGALHFFLCERAARLCGRTELPLALALPAAMAIARLLPFAIFWILAGRAGQLVGSDRRAGALWLGAATFGFLFLTSVRRAFRAHEYRDVAHVTIQGGVAGAVGWGAACLVLALLCLLGLRHTRSGRGTS